MENIEKPELSFSRRALWSGGVVAAAAGVGLPELLSPHAAHAAAAEGSVSSVNGRTGDVVLTAADVGATPSSGVDAIAVVASADRFPGLDPSGDRDSAPALLAAMQTVPDGGTLLVPPGRYLVRQPLSPQDGKSITVSAYGALFIQAQSFSVFSLFGSYGTEYPVTSLTTAVVSFPNSSEPTTVLNLASAPTWAPGDVLRIVSDDVIPGSRPASGGLASRTGEFGVVYSVSGTTVTLAGRLRDPFTTGIRAALTSKQTMRIVGAEFETANSRFGQSNQALIAFANLHNPSVIDIRVRRAGDQVVSFLSCLGYLVQNADIALANDVPSSNILGYGVLDNSSSFGRIIGGTFRHVRHAYTDDSRRIAAGSDMRNYGRTFGAKIIGAQAHMTTSASFDTHASSEGTEFISCSANAGVPKGAQAIGFSLRGESHRVSNCTAIGMQYGVAVVSDSVGGESRGHKITGLFVRDSSRGGINVRLRSAGHPLAKQRDTTLNVTVEGYTDIGSPVLLYSEHATVNLRNVRWSAPAGVADGVYEGIYGRNSRVSVFDAVFDLRPNTAGVVRPLSAPSVAADETPGPQNTVIDGLYILANQDVTGRSRTVTVGAQQIVQARRLRFSYPFPNAPGASSDLSVWQWECDHDPDVPASELNSSSYYLSGAAASGSLKEQLKSLDPVVSLQVNPSGSRTLAALASGKRRGQTLHVVVLGSGSLAVRNGSAYGTRLKGSQNRTLAVGDTMTLLWLGGIWVEI